MSEIKLGSFRFSIYWSMLLFAAVFIIVSGILRAKKANIPIWKAIVISLFVLFYGCIGTKLLFMLEHPDKPFSLRGGMSLFGSIYLIPIGFAVTVPFIKIKYRKCMDFITLYGPLTFAFMRIGCYFIGCCGGREILLFGFRFVPPVQLIECFFDFVIFLLLLLSEKKASSRTACGFRYPVFMISYSSIRFLIEFWRKTPTIWFFLSEGQLLSVVTFLLGISIFFLKFILKKEKEFSL